MNNNAKVCAFYEIAKALAFFKGKMVILLLLNGGDCYQDDKYHSFLLNVFLGFTFFLLPLFHSL